MKLTSKMGTCTRLAIKKSTRAKKYQLFEKHFSRTPSDGYNL
jgi:hypothetical protein